MATSPVVAAAENHEHVAGSVARTVRHIAESLAIVPRIIRRGDRVLVKVNMGCSGAREPEQRLTTHPAVAEAVIEVLLDCGATVSFGDDVSRTGRHSDDIYRATGMADVARRTGARLVDFIATGAREVCGRLVYPRSYLITNRYFEADRVVSVANCRSHVGVGLSGAIKNMFGCVVGWRKRAIHNLFPGDPRRFGRVLADIYRVIPADLSWLDLTSVAESAGINLAVRPVGLMLAGTDAVALDTVASHAIGYDYMPVWPTYYAARFGVGSSRIEEIRIRGIDWNIWPKARLGPPAISRVKTSAYERFSAVVNNTILRARPLISESKCTRCGECIERCPADCIVQQKSRPYRIDLARCADCGCCVAVCDAGAVRLEHVGWGKAARRLLGRLPSVGAPGEPYGDPAGRW